MNAQHLTDAIFFLGGGLLSTAAWAWALNRCERAHEHEVGQLSDELAATYRGHEQARRRVEVQIDRANAAEAKLRDALLKRHQFEDRADAAHARIADLEAQLAPFKRPVRGAVGKFAKRVA